ncbi:MAG TPA: glycosyltransferase [Mucilaginibacter sp.]|nr:glycosyltransferase [Mucilaginibacter sp.]
MPHLVSIALCTYNGEKFLARLLDSLLAQDYKPMEIIAVDDCSNDNTWNILQEYAQKDPRLKPYQNEQNLGHTLNFEKAIKLCGSDFIALADQDDLWERDKLKIMMGCAGGCVMVYHDSDFIDDEGKRIGDKTMASNHRMYEGNSSLPIILGNNIHGHSILFDSKLKQYLSPFNAGFSHDWAIAFAAFNAGKVKYVDQVLVHYRQHQHSITDFLEQREDEAPTNKARNLERLGVTISWLNYCLKFQPKKEPELVHRACGLFSDLMKGENKFSCFLFMLKHFDLLFYTMNNKRRTFLSKVNFVRKLCFD